MVEREFHNYGGNDNYTYIIKGLPSYTPISDPQYPTRHRAVGEKANLEAIHLCDLEIVATERMATDPANKITARTDREIKAKVQSE